MSWGCRTEVPTLGGFSSRHLSAHSLEARRGDQVWAAGSFPGCKANTVQASPSFQCPPDILGVSSLSVITWPSPIHGVCVCLQISPSLKDSPPAGGGPPPPSLSRPRLH